MVLGWGLIFDYLLAEHFVHLDDFFFDCFPDFNEFVHFVEGEIPPVEDVFLKELDEGAGEDLLDLVDVVLGFGLDVVEVGDYFELVEGLGVFFLCGIGEVDEFFDVNLELFPLLFHFVEFFLVDEFSGGDVWDFD